MVSTGSSGSSDRRGHLPALGSMVVAAHQVAPGCARRSAASRPAGSPGARCAGRARPPLMCGCDARAGAAWPRRARADHGRRTRSRSVDGSTATPCATPYQRRRRRTARRCTARRVERRPASAGATRRCRRRAGASTGWRGRGGRRLLDRLGGDAGQRLVGDCGAAPRRAELVRREEQQPGHRDAEVAVSGARPAGRCGTRARRAGRPARPRRGRAPSTSPAYVSSERAWPSWSRRCWPARRPPRAAGAAAIHSPSRCARSARRRRGRSAYSTSEVAHRCSHAFRDLVEGRVPVDLVGGRVEERVLLVRAGRGDRRRPAPPRSTRPPGGGCRRRGRCAGPSRVGRVQAADVRVRQPAAGPDEDLPQRPVACSCGALRLLRCALLRRRTPRPPRAPRRRPRAPARGAPSAAALHGPLPLITSNSSVKSSSVKS